MSTRLFTSAARLLAAFVPVGAKAGVFVLPFTVGTAIPDGDRSGMIDVRTVSVPETRILDVDVTLNIHAAGDGAFNGDLYAYLEHDSGISILLNRPGSRDADPYGYADSGLGEVTLDDEASSGDIHEYRLTVTGGHGVPLPLGADLSLGSWLPDARHVDPEQVRDTSARNAPLAAFDGLDPNGTWTLFVADVSVGGTVVLDSWTLQITAVPEPALLGYLAGLGLLGVASVRRAIERGSKSRPESRSR